ncbi:hypothetical protein FB451DRAFT_1291971 [Mycena latifolia]|nr:hypothetical protein FB451DRAFT_1291971 [Mycena latifolia]
MPPPRALSVALQAKAGGTDSLLSTIQDLAESVHLGDKDPEWSAKHQSTFIQTIILNHATLPFIFVKNKLDDGTEFTRCLDGRQRLIAIRNPDDRERWFKSASHPRVETVKHLLSESERRDFPCRKFVCVEYTGISTAEEITDRVRHATVVVPLAPAKFKAIKTPRADFVRLLCEAYLDSAMNPVLTWKDEEATDFTAVYLCVAQIVQALEDTRTAHLNLLLLREWVLQGDAIPPLTTESVKHTFGTFRLLVIDPRYGAVFREPTPLSPLEFMAVGMLIAIRKDSLSLRQLVTAILTLRREVVKQEQWMAENFFTIMKFIYEYKP